jgi:single-stranded-DNA-specific exonuclease
MTPELVDALTQLDPFGAANPKPLFRAGPVVLHGTPKTVKERHLKLIFKQEGRALPAIAWRLADRCDYLTANRDELELAYSLEAREYQGVRTTQLTVADVRVPAGVCV